MFDSPLFSAGSNVWLQQFESLWPLARILSLLGNEEFFLLLLPIVYFGFSCRRGVRLGALLLVSEGLNICLKVLFALPRPYWVSSEVFPIATDASFGLPSSHAQNAAAIWPFLARGRAFGWRLAAAFLVAGIALSRVFLGVHFVGDVLGGVLLGTGVLWAFSWIAPKLEGWFEEQSGTRQVLVALGAALLMLVLFGLAQVLAPSRGGESWAAEADFDAGSRAIVGRAGALFGLIAGAAMCARRGRFQPAATIGGKILHVVVALFGVAFFYKGLALVLPTEPAAVDCLGRFARYAALAWWITDGTPRLIELLGSTSARRRETAGESVR
jgi:membrane-associated phospholipid phosphatase